MANNIIVMNRGDTLEIPIVIEDEQASTGYYILQGDDAVYFGIMDPRQQFEDALVKKKVDWSTQYIDSEGNITITLDPEDTLDLMPGKYYYAVKLKQDHITTEGEEVYGIKTIIDKTKFIILD